MFPGHFEARPAAVNPLWQLLNSWDSWGNPYLIRDIAANLALYVPLGLAAHFVFRNFFRNGGPPMFELFGPVLFGFLLSFSIEILQEFEPSRHASTVDLLSNTMGTGLGVVAAVLCEAVFARAGRRLADPAAAALAAGWLGYLFFPFFPAMDRARHFVTHAAAFAATPVFAVAPIATTAACWFAAGILLRAAGVGRAREWLACALAFSPLQLLIVDRTPSRAALLGAVLGVFLFAVRPRQAKVTAPLAGGFLAALTGTALWSALSGRGGEAAWHPFEWTPFAHLIGMDAQAGLLILGGQLLGYGSAIWLLRASGMRAVKAVAIVVGVALCLELVQLRAPGAYPGITGPLLAILAGYVLSALSPGFTGGNATNR